MKKNIAAGLLASAYQVNTFPLSMNNHENSGIIFTLHNWHVNQFLVLFTTSYNAVTATGIAPVLHRTSLLIPEMKPGTVTPANVAQQTRLAKRN